MLTALVTELVTATEPASESPVLVLVNYGALGIFILLLITGQVRTKAEVQRLEEQNKQQSDIIKTFQMQLTTSTLPAMAKSAQVLEAIPDKDDQMLQELKATQEQTREILSRLENLANPKGK